MNGKFVVGGLYITYYADPFFIIDLKNDNKSAVGLYYRYCPAVLKLRKSRHIWQKDTVNVRNLMLDGYQPKRDIKSIIGAIQSLRTRRSTHKDLKDKIIEFLLEA